MKIGYMVGEATNETFFGWLEDEVNLPAKFLEFARYRAAPSSMVVCPSCPQACMVPSWVERCANEFFSRMGNASISARRPMDLVSLPT